MREPYRLAILDDEPLIAMGLKKLILHMGHSRIGQITTYTMPADALKGILKNPPDLLFTDIKMPEMTGLELAERLRNEGLDILVVILSGYDDFFLVQKALRLGCHDYLRKPASTEDIARVLDRSASLLDSNISQ